MIKKRVPPKPKFPRPHSFQEKKTESSISTESISAEVSELDFSSSKFSVDSYVRERFVEHNADHVKEYYKALTVEAKNTSENMKSSVYRNFPKFIEASKEIESLESETISLRSLLTEMNSVFKGIERFGFELETKLFSQDQSSLPEHAIKEIQWLLDLPDKLDSSLCLRKFDAALLLFQKGELLLKENPPLESLLANSVKVQIKEKREHLVDLLLASLQNPTTNSSETSEIVILLCKLGLADKASRVLLEMKSKKLDREIKTINLEGDLVFYIRDLAQKIFSNINSTCEEFRSSFDQPHMYSGLTVWIIGELQRFGSIFRNQVFRNSDNFLSIGRCIEIAMLHCNLLEIKGLSLSFLLKEMFFSDLVNAIGNYHRSLENHLLKKISNDNWILSRVEITGLTTDGMLATKSKEEAKKASNGLQLTESGLFLYNISQEFINNVGHIINLELVPSVTTVISNLFSVYLIQLRKQFELGTLNLNDQQCLAILCNANHTVEEFLLRMTKQLETKLGKTLRDFDSILKLLEDLREKLRLAYGRYRAEFLVRNVLIWGKFNFYDYLSANKISEKSAMPSKQFMELFDVLADWKSLASEILSSKEVTLLFCILVEELSVSLAKG